MIPVSIGSIAIDKKNINFYGLDDFSPEESYSYLMKQILISMLHQANARLSSCRLTRAQRELLMRLKIAGSSTVTDMARSLQVDAGATTRLVDRLERLGFCRRLRTNTDRREVTVELTHEGELEICDVPAVSCLVMNEHLAGFSTAEMSTFKTYLLRIIENGKALKSK